VKLGGSIGRRRDAAFGQFLHHEPESTITPDQPAANRSDGLLITVQRARQDEDCGLHALPLLLRVDRRCSCKVAAATTWTAEGESSATTPRSQGWCACTVWLGAIAIRGQGTLCSTSVVSIGRHTVVEAAAAAEAGDEASAPVDVAMPPSRYH
jgi:hypothetical protein